MSFQSREALQMLPLGKNATITSFIRNSGLLDEPPHVVEGTADEVVVPVDREGAGAQVVEGAGAVVDRVVSDTVISADVRVVDRSAIA